MYHNGTNKTICSIMVPIVVLCDFSIASDSYVKGKSLLNVSELSDSKTSFLCIMFES